MVNIFSTELKTIQPLISSLTSIYGIGVSNSKRFCKKLGFSKNYKVQNLTEDQLFKIIKLIELENTILTNELKKFNSINLQKLITIKSYRGLRRIVGLPVRGQRTHTNAKTARKKRF